MNIELSLSYHGYQLTQIQREGDIAIYAAKRPEQMSPHHWEIIRIKREKAKEAFGKSYPDREVYPGAEEWGRLGWTAVSLEAAHARLKTWSMEAKDES